MNFGMTNQSQIEAAHALLSQLFYSPYANAWGSKGYLIDRIRRATGLSIKAAKAAHTSWVATQSAVS